MLDKKQNKLLCEYYIECETKKTKVSSKIKRMPHIKEYNKLLNLGLEDLKKIKKHYKITGGKNKEEMKYFLYNNLRLRNSLSIILKNYRYYKLKRFKELQEIYKDVIFEKEVEYVNDIDYESLEPLSKINKMDKIAIIDEDKKTYGFNIWSVDKLFIQYKKNAFNPFTRSTLSKESYDRVKELQKIRKILAIPEPKTEEIVLTKSQKQKMEENDIFYEINQLGNYADSIWFANLNKYKLLKYVEEIIDIWEYRANLSYHQKQAIYTNINPFYDISINILRNLSENVIRKEIIKIMRRFIGSSSIENAQLGAFYVLGTLTLVSSEAANALPWLYQSFYHGGQMIAL